MLSGARSGGSAAREVSRGGRAAGGASGGRARLTRQAPPPPRPWGRATAKALGRPEASARRAAPFGPLRPPSAPRSPVSPSAGSTGDSRAPRLPTATRPHSKAPSGPHGARGAAGRAARGLRGEQPGRYPSQAPSRVVSAPGLPKTCQAGCDHPCVLRGVAAHRDPFVFGGLGKALSDAQTRALCVRSGARSGTQRRPGEQRRGPPRRH